MHRRPKLSDKQMARCPIIPWVSEPPAPHFISQTRGQFLRRTQLCRREGRGRERGSFGGAEPTCFSPASSLQPWYGTMGGNQALFHEHRCCFWYGYNLGYGAGTWYSKGKGAA